MKIGIDARLYGIGHRGLGRYTQKLIEQLERLDHDNEYVIFLQPEEYEQYQPVNPKFTKVLAPYRPYSWQEQLIFPQLIGKYHPDLMHFPHFNVPVIYGCPYVVTIHDLIITHYPTSRATTRNKFVYQLKLFGYRVIVKLAAKRARQVITVSDFTRQDIIKLLGVAESKVVRIYEGADPVSPAQTEPIFAPQTYLLSVGAAYPHKNLEFLCKAFSKFATDKDYKLILVGRKDVFYERLEQSLTDEQKKNIIFFGEATDEQLANLYRNALAYVFPSLLEGFGLPALEAQSANIPVISSNLSSLPEVLGDSALFFDPNNQQALIDELQKISTDSALRSKLIEQGGENIKRFSWEQMGREILKIYTRR